MELHIYWLLGPLSRNE